MGTQSGAVLDDDPDLVVDVMMAVGGRMSGDPLPDDARPVVAAMAEDEGRVVVRCRPYSTFAQPPRHLRRNDQPEAVTQTGCPQRCRSMTKQMARHVAF